MTTLEPPALMHVVCCVQLTCLHEAQQTQHTAQVKSLRKEAEHMQSLIRQGAELDQQRLAELDAHTAEAGSLRQVCTSGN